MPLYYDILKRLDDAKITPAQWKVELESSCYEKNVSPAEQKQYEEMYGKVHGLLEDMERILLKKAAGVR